MLLKKVNFIFSTKWYPFLQGSFIICLVNSGKTAIPSKKFFLNIFLKFLSKHYQNPGLTGCMCVSDPYRETPKNEMITWFKSKNAWSLTLPLSFLLRIAEQPPLSKYCRKIFKERKFSPEWESNPCTIASKKNTLR